MLRMQKKPTPTPTEDPKQETNENPTVSANGKESTETDKKEEEAGLSLLGIGGKQIRAGSAKKAGKKRTPGEIRIQNGIIYSIIKYH